MILSNRPRASSSSDAKIASRVLSCKTKGASAGRGSKRTALLDVRLREERVTSRVLE